MTNEDGKRTEVDWENETPEEAEARRKAEIDAIFAKRAPRGINKKTGGTFAGTTVYKHSMSHGYNQNGTLRRKNRNRPKKKK